MITASLFAGCGGSSLGYRAAGFDVRYACELDDWAAEAYEINGGCRVDRRSVEEVTGAEILQACGGTVDVLDASPPCQSFSMAGPRGLDGRLFLQTVRLVGEVRPRVVAVENVEGFTLGERAERLCNDTLRGLDQEGYRVAWRVLDSSWYGVPQARRRVVVLGFRRELGIDPEAAFPQPRSRQSVMRDALPDVLRLVIDAPQGRVGDTFPRGRKTRAASEPAPTVMARGMAATSLDRAWVQQTPDGRPRPVSIEDLLALQAFPASFRLPTDDRELAWQAIGNAVPPPLAEAWARSIADALAKTGALSTR